MKLEMRMWYSTSSSSSCMTCNSKSKSIRGMVNTFWCSEKTHVQFSFMLIHCSVMNKKKIPKTKAIIDFNWKRLFRKQWITVTCSCHWKFNKSLFNLLFIIITIQFTSQKLTTYFEISVSFEWVKNSMWNESAELRLRHMVINRPKNINQSIVQIIYIFFMA